MSQLDASGPLPPKPKRPHTGLGIALIVLGLLFLIPSGLCTGIFGLGAIWGAITDPANAGDAASVVVMALMFGGIPLAIGIALTVVGNSLRKPD